MFHQRGGTSLPHTLVWRIPVSPTIDTKQPPHTEDCRSQEADWWHLTPEEKETKGWHKNQIIIKYDQTIDIIEGMNWYPFSYNTIPLATTQGQNKHAMKELKANMHIYGPRPWESKVFLNKPWSPNTHRWCHKYPFCYKRENTPSQTDPLPFFSPGAVGTLYAMTPNSFFSGFAFF